MKDNNLQATITGVTVPSSDISIEMEEMKSMCGDYAGVCYSSKRFSERNESTLKTLARYHNLVHKVGHPVNEHCNVTIVFENLSKIQAIILNSMGRYSTLERSARYTNISNRIQDPKEKRLYQKWLDKFTNLFKAKGLSDVKSKKLAQENARYVISVFTPFTTMVYTMNLRMWNRLINDLDELIKYSEPGTLSSNRFCSIYFEQSYMDELHNQAIELRETIINSGVVDTAVKRPVSCSVPYLVEHMDVLYAAPTDIIEQYGFSYTISYKMSFAAYAQEQRHRTIKHYCSSPRGELYIPDILKDTDNNDIVDEWVADLREIQTPQASLVTVVEVGTISDFEAKCQDRLCAKAQTEIRKVTEESYRKLRDNLKKEYNYDLQVGTCKSCSSAATCKYHRNIDGKYDL